MFRALRYLAVLAALVAGAVWLADNAGAVTLNWRGWRIDTSVAVLLTAVAVVTVAAGILYRLWLFAARAPGELRETWRLRRRERGYRALTRGMVAVAAGDGAEARRQARRAEGLLNEPPLTLLLQAQSAQLSGDEQAAARFFAAMAARPETEFLGVRGLLGQAAKRDDRAGALDLARRAWRLKPKSGWVAGVLFDLEVKESRWLDALATLDAAIDAGAVDKAAGRRRRVALLVELARAERQRGEARVEDVQRFAGEAHKLAPDSIPAALAFADALLARDKRRKAAGVIERTFALAPHPDLAALYPRTRGAEGALAAAREVRDLTRAVADRPEGRLALARAMIEAKLWGEARAALDGFGENPPARACRLMAEIEDAERDDATAARQWLLRAAMAEVDPAWTCESCGTAAPEWRAVCAKCGAFDTAAWRAPAIGPARIAPPR